MLMTHASIFAFLVWGICGSHDDGQYTETESEKEGGSHGQEILNADTESSAHSKRSCPPPTVASMQF